MASKGYWDSWTHLRLGRRNFLTGAVATGAALAGAGACTATPAAPTEAPTAVRAAATSAPAAAVAATATPAAPAPKYGGVATFATTGDTPTLDPHATSNTLLLTVGPGLVYSRLVLPTAGPERKGNEVLIAGDVASSWDQLDDLTYVFKLRPGVKFHNLPPVNGRELTADDIVYSFNRQRSLRTNASYLPDMAKLEAVDKLTVKITTPKPDADFLRTLAAYPNVIVAHEAVDLKGDLKEGPNIGTGAWLFDQWQPNSLARLKRNPDFYIKGVPYVDALEFLRIGDDATILQAFRTQKILYSRPSFTNSDIASLKKQFPELITGSERRMSSDIVLGYDVTKPPFNDQRVRQAFQLAIDRPAVWNTVFEGQGYFTTGIFLPDFSYDIPEDEFKNKWYKRDVAQAKALLSAAGVAPGFEVELTFLQFQSTWTSAAEFTVAQLKDINVAGRLKAADAAAWTQGVLAAQGDYQAYFGTHLAANSTNADLYQRFYSTGSRNSGRIRDPKLDAMIDQQAVMVRDPAARKQALQAIERYVLDQAYLTDIVGLESPYVYWPWLKNYRPQSQPIDGEFYKWMWLDK